MPERFQGRTDISELALHDKKVLPTFAQWRLMFTVEV